VHLPGEADGGDVVAGRAGLRQCLANTRHDAVPPVARVLLGPQRLGGGERQGGRGGRHDGAGRVHQQGFRAGGGNVNAEKKVFSHGSLLK
jgi:hypothetical protein